MILFEQPLNNIKLTLNSHLKLSRARSVTHFHKNKISTSTKTVVFFGEKRFVDMPSPIFIQPEKL